MGIQIINGIEISSQNDGEIDLLGLKGSLHILAYSFDYDKLNNTYADIKIRKDELAVKLVKKLISDGYNIHECMELEKLNTTLIGKRLVQKGYAKSLDEAFDNILDLKYSEYRIKSFTITNVIKLIHKCGGLAVLAHPYEVLQGVYKVNLEPEQVEKIVNKLVSFGIDGIEVYYARYTNEQVRFLEKLAEKHGLFKTVGSDFHGKFEDEYQLLDKGHGNFEILNQLSK